MERRKAQIVEGLYTWIHQRPGLDPRNYISGWDDKAGRSAYRSEVRRIGKQLQTARTLLRAVELTDSITANDLLAATRAYSGRLSIKETATVEPSGSWPHGVKQSTFSIDYCTGQYWPTEYRAAVCAVLASALWDWKRDKAMPQPVKLADGNKVYGHAALSGGEWLRRSFRREYGRSIQSTWFD